MVEVVGRPEAQEHAERQQDTEVTPFVAGIKAVHTKVLSTGFVADDVMRGAREFGVLQLVRHQS